MASKVPRGVKVQTERRLSTESACSLCCHDTKVWVVSPCDHHVCLTCAARLRVLCDTKECPVCRENNEKVIVVEKRQSFHSVVSRKNLIPNRKFGFLFESRKLVDAFESLRIPKCVKCEGEGGGRVGEGGGGGGGGSNRFTNMKALQDHLRKEHHLLMCEICVDHLKLFPHEYKLYTREQLARHRREGDPGDPAYKGHPLCQFCEERFLDTETLFFHLKNKHFWCHICEVDGSQDYYASYAELRTHFRQSHYLCSEGPCRYEKFTTVFRTKLDFQAHKAKEHCKGLSKAEAKQLRQVDVGFVYSKTEETEGMPPVSQRQYHQTTRQKKQRPISKEMEDIEAAKTLSLIEQQKKETNPTNSSTSEENSPDPQQDTAHPLAADKKNGHIPHNKSLPTLMSAAEQKRGPSEWPLLPNETQQETKAPPPVPPNLAPPPGLTCPGHKPPPGFTTASLPVPKVEFDVYEMVQKLLDNNMKKVSLFRKWCGMYLMAELTAEQYYQYCSEMFGSAWNEFGLQLVETLPDPVKRTELYSLFDNENKKTTVAIKPPPGLSSSSTVQPSSSRVKSKKTKSQATADVPDTRPWHSSSNRSKVSLKSEEEFPSLSLKSMSKATAPVAAMPCWNIKVK